MTLANKYRPQRFEDMTEQTLIVDILQNMCKGELSNRNFLFIGPAGTGKTTTARIVANMLNDGQGEIIEVDGATHGGVDSIRDITQQARTYPIGCKYKTIIMDECFHANTLVSTPLGLRRICDVQPGEQVYNLTGCATVTHSFKNKIDVSNLLYLRVGNKEIITTKNHLFFTDVGWVEAQNLIKGDVLYDYQEMQNMRNRVPNLLTQSGDLRETMQSGVDESEKERAKIVWLRQVVSDLWEGILDNRKHKCTDMLQKVRLQVCERTRDFPETERLICQFTGGLYLSYMQQTYDNKEIGQAENLQQSLFWDSTKTIESAKQDTIDEILHNMWEYIQSEVTKCKNLQSSMYGETEQFASNGEERCRVISKDVESQPHVSTGSVKKDDRNSESEWKLECLEGSTWGEWSIYQAADSFEKLPNRGVGIRVSRQDRDKTKRQSEQLPYQLQTRPCLSEFNARCRGRWERPQYEVATVARRKESEMSGKFGVENIEVYKLGHNDGLFRNYFSAEQLNSGTVELYDLEVDGHPSYYVEGLLVHNCHAISSAGWASFLKCLEESPARTIFIFCTTNPEKIPDTILSRVQVFQLSKISLEGINRRLIHVLDSEIAEGRPVTYTADAVNFIAKLSSGGLRDSLTLLDKALAYSNDINSENLMKALNLPNYDDYFTLLQAIASKNNAVITQTVHDVYNSGVNFIKWFEGFHSFVINIVKYIFMQDISKTMIPSHYADKMSGYKAAHSAICLRLAAKLLTIIHELKSTNYQQELALTYLCTPPQKEN